LLVLGGVLTLVSAASLFVGLARPLLFGLDLLLLVAVAVDFLWTPSPDRFHVERTLPTRVGLDQQLPREVTVRHAGAAGLACELHEEFPAAFDVVSRTAGGGDAPPADGDPTGGPDEVVLDESGAGVARRVYRSHLRGVHAFGDLRLRVRGRLGLIHRQRRLVAPQEVAVEPALSDLGRTLRLAASDRWHDLGVRLLRRRGGQTEFESLRDYVNGDDPRRVDWKAFARRGRPMVRQYQEERGQELLLLIDCGRRMRATAVEGAERGWTKLDWALDAALQLAAVALSKGDRVGIAAFESKLLAYVGPQRGARQNERLAEAVFHLQPSEREANLERALREVAARHRRRATLVVLSDVADPLSIDSQRRALAALSRRHRLVFAALDDPGLRRAARQRTEHPAVVRAAACELVADRARALKGLASTGVRVLDALPAEAAAPLLAAWLEERRAFSGA
jgi:uncharacterized protein (DUF58 family)